MLQWTLGCMCLFEIWFSQGVCPEVGLLGHMVVLILVFWGTSILFSTVDEMRDYHGTTEYENLFREGRRDNEGEERQGKKEKQIFVKIRNILISEFRL